MIDVRNLGCRAACCLSLLAMGLLKVFNASVPSFNSGRTITLPYKNGAHQVFDKLSRSGKTIKYNMLHSTTMNQPDCYDFLGDEAKRRGQWEQGGGLRKEAKSAFPWRLILL